MARQYQSFPDSKGSSDSRAKLEALKIPALENKSFLDVGCNEGFFCEFARYLKASRVVGIDAHQGFIEAAKKRFPAIEFYCQKWNELPTGPYDVILLSSALHYADDQPALIRRIMANLAPGGLFILEAGIAEGDKNEWVETQRGDVDTRTFPTLRKMREILEPYSFRNVGPSVGQRSDPNKRFVFHITHRLPYAVLAMGDPGTGKSNLARTMSSTKILRSIGIDGLLAAIFESKVDDRILADFLQQHGFERDARRAVIDTLFRSGMHIRLLDIVRRDAAGRDFIYDGYVPAEYRQSVRNYFVHHGFVAVMVEPTTPNQPTRVRGAEKYDAFMAHLEKTASLPA